MAKIYTRMYNTNHESLFKAHEPLVVPTGKMTCFAIPFPSEGYMERLIVWQATGTEVDFEVELLNSQLPFPPGDYEPTDEPADELTSYRIPLPVTAPLTADAGNVLAFIDDDFGPGFRNVDGGWTLNTRAVYLLIHPVDSVDETSWNVTFQCRTDVS